jgi:hypothetical protein
LIDLASFRVVGYPEVIHFTLRGTLATILPLYPGRLQRSTVAAK